jgi:uncharacterized membrane protein
MRRNKKKNRQRNHQQNKALHPAITLNSDNNALQKDNPIKQVATTLAQVTSFSGPIPHPELLAQYDQIIPKGADRILKMAERQSEHRQYLEKWSIVGGTILSYLGVLCAGGISIFVSHLGCQLILKG